MVYFKLVNYCFTRDIAIIVTNINLKVVASETEKLMIGKVIIKFIVIGFFH